MLAEYPKTLQRINLTKKQNVRNTLLFPMPLGQHCKKDLAVHFTPLLCAHTYVLFLKNKQKSLITISVSLNNVGVS